MQRKVVKFLSTEQFESEGRNKGPIFDEGQEYDFEASFADRWLQRGVAELVREYSDDPIIDAADADQVAALQGAIEARFERQLGEMSADLSTARQALAAALGAE